MTTLSLAENGTCEEIAQVLGEWPNCAVPDCEYKACLRLSSPLCYAHTLGRQPVPFAEYMKMKPQ